MSENNERMLREELRAAVNEKDFTVAVEKAEQMANHYEEIGDAKKARESWIEAARLFLDWSKIQRENRTHKNSAKSLVFAADIFSKLGIDTEAAQAIDLAAQDLVFAGEEYIVWKQPVGAGVCFAAAAILFVLVSQEEKAHQVIDQVRTRLDALRHDSTANALMDLPLQLIHAKNNLDIRLLNNVKTMVYSSLIPALTNSGLTEFSSYIERTILGVENFINATQKYPVLEYDIKMKGEVKVDEAFDIEVMVKNAGEDTALNVELEMVPLKEVTIVREFSKLKANDIPPGSTVAFAWRCIVKAKDLDEESKQINLSARLSFSDSKNLRQTLTVSPIAFSTLSTKEQDQVSMELNIIKDNIQKAKEKVLPAAKKAGDKVIAKIFDIMAQLVDQTNGFIEAGAIQNAKSWNKLLQLQIELFSDIPNQIDFDKDDDKEDKEEEEKKDS
ncbi:MAG: hypothetical protein KGD59_02950 [Candidatus Heimdallarchaeota archaeon]|nr:hypothetical protein [Candidatus Heimdallarchaeota archaeon]MBY8993480.1 hypothetical protein [Candidatus Heimdallarchaeota archaeon]